MRELLSDSSPATCPVRCAACRLTRRTAGGPSWFTWAGWRGIPTPDFPLHHQIIVRRPLGEGNSVFASLSPAWDASRAPAGHRALTLSTHTALAGWWELLRTRPPGLRSPESRDRRKAADAAEHALPGLRLRRPAGAARHADHLSTLHRAHVGWVGGFPQTGLAAGRQAPRLGPNLWLVGDSIFPGQSTAAAALGGLWIARDGAGGQSITR